MAEGGAVLPGCKAGAGWWHNGCSGVAASRLRLEIVTATGRWGRVRLLSVVQSIATKDRQITRCYHTITPRKSCKLRAASYLTAHAIDTQGQ